MGQRMCVRGQYSKIQFFLQDFLIRFRSLKARAEHRPTSRRKLVGPAMPPVPFAGARKGNDARKEGNVEACRAMGKRGKEYENSREQEDEQPSPLLILPSSHCSLPSMMPLPHDGEEADGEEGSAGRAFCAFRKRSTSAEKLLACSAEGITWRAEGSFAAEAEKAGNLRTVENEDAENPSIAGTTGASRHWMQGRAFVARQISPRVPQ